MKLLENIIDFLLSPKFYGPIICVILGIFAFNIINKLIDKFMLKKSSNKNFKKRQTVINLIKNVCKYIIVVIVFLIVLEIYGINTMSILASLGVAGVIIGLAFQDTMKNMLAGIFIILDSRYNVDDFIEINGFKGTVQYLGLQTTKLKSFAGEIFTIANSAITSVINYSECNSTLFLDIPVSYKTDIEKLEKVLERISKESEKLENVIKPLSLLGVDSFGPSEIVYKVSIECAPTTQAGVKRQLLKLINVEFNKEKIEIPYNQVDLHVIETGK